MSIGSEFQTLGAAKLNARLAQLAVSVGYMSLEQTGAERQWTVATASSLDTATVHRGMAGQTSTSLVCDDSNLVPDTRCCIGSQCNDFNTVVMR